MSLHILLNKSYEIAQIGMTICPLMGKKLKAKEETTYKLTSVQLNGLARTAR